MMVEALPENCACSISVIGPAQLPATPHGLILGGHVRVGLEDNNVLLCQGRASYPRAARGAHRVHHGRVVLETSNPSEAREMLGLKPVEVLAST
jgi:uncharacterized protein (DUF849 family)